MLDHGSLIDVTSIVFVCWGRIVCVVLCVCAAPLLFFQNPIILGLTGD